MLYSFKEYAPIYLFIQLLMDFRLFQFWGITNKVTMHILIFQICLYMDIHFLGYIPRME